MKTIPIRASAPPPTPPADPRWRWHRLLDAPHRLAFFAGALVLGTSALWWALVMLARSVGVTLPWQVPPATAHSLLMGYGFMPLFFCGFLFTAGPKWLAQPPVDAASLRAPVIASLIGWALFIIGTHASVLLAAFGLAISACAFAALALRFARLVHTSRSPDRVHARLVLCGCGVGVLLWLAAAVSLALGHHVIVRAATLAGLWGFIAVVFVSVSHRMVPFFSGSPLPRLDAWLLWLLAGAVLAEAPLAAAEALWWPLPRPVLAAAAIVEAAIGALLLAQAVYWRRVQNLKPRLLTMLHLGFVWLGITFALSAVSHAWMAIEPGAAGLGLAPIHALGAGFFSSTLLATVSRVSAGHSGRAVAADDIVWWLFWLLQVAVVARVGASVWASGAGVLLPIAAVAWAAAMLAWAARNGRWYGTARVDGRVG